MEAKEITIGLSSLSVLRLSVVFLINISQASGEQETQEPTVSVEMSLLKHPADETSGSRSREAKTKTRPLWSLCYPAPQICLEWTLPFIMYFKNTQHWECFRDRGLFLPGSTIPSVCKMEIIIFYFATEIYSEAEKGWTHQPWPTDTHTDFYCSEFLSASGPLFSYMNTSATAQRKPLFQDTWVLSAHHLTLLSWQCDIILHRKVLSGPFNKHHFFNLPFQGQVLSLFSEHSQGLEVAMPSLFG